MSTARLFVNIDGETKQNSQKFLGEIGMYLTHDETVACLYIHVKSIMMKNTFKNH